MRGICIYDRYDDKVGQITTGIPCFAFFGDCATRSQLSFLNGLITSAPSSGNWCRYKGGKATSPIELTFSADVTTISGKWPGLTKLTPRSQSTQSCRNMCVNVPALNLWSPIGKLMIITAFLGPRVGRLCSVVWNSWPLVTFTTVPRCS